jgi:hypothetical protein
LWLCVAAVFVIFLLLGIIGVFVKPSSISRDEKRVTKPTLFVAKPGPQTTCSLVVPGRSVAAGQTHACQALSALRQDMRELTDS